MVLPYIQKPLELSATKPLPEENTFVFIKIKVRSCTGIKEKYAEKHFNILKYD